MTIFVELLMLALLGIYFYAYYMKRWQSYKNGAEYAATMNGRIGAAQLLAGVATGNIGFLGLAAESAGDYLSFNAKSGAHDVGDTDPKRAKTRRFGAAAIYLSGGLTNIGLGWHQLMSEQSENATATAIALAVPIALAGGLIAKRSTQLDRHHTCSSDRQTALHTRIHTVLDAGSGIAYAGGLVAHYLTNNGNFSTAGVLTAGVVGTSGALYTLHENRASAQHEEHSAPEL